MLDRICDAREGISFHAVAFRGFCQARSLPWEGMPSYRPALSYELPYHLTARVNKREDFPGGTARAWEIFTEEIYLQGILHGVRVHGFVLMPNHFHLLATCPGCSVSKFMQNFISSSTRILNEANRQSGRVFGARYYASLITNSLYFAHALKYVYRNPVKAGLTECVTEYPYSTLPSLFGLARARLAICSPAPDLARHLPAPDQFEPLLDWLNRPHRKEEAEALRRGFRKKEFALPLHRSSRRKIDLEIPFDAVAKPKGL